MFFEVDCNSLAVSDSNRIYQYTARQRKLRWRQISIDYNKNTVSEIRDSQEQLLFSLRNEHAATMKRLRQVEARLDSLLLVASDAAIKAADPLR